jgi:hypothetical protein
LLFFLSWDGAVDPWQVYTQEYLVYLAEDASGTARSQVESAVPVGGLAQQRPARFSSQNGGSTVSLMGNFMGVKISQDITKFYSNKDSDVRRHKLFLVQQKQRGHVQRKRRHIQISTIKGADKIEILNNPEAHKFAQRGPWGLHFFVVIPKEIEKTITVLYRRIVLFSFFLVGC